MMENILKGEIYCRLKTIHKYYKKLQNQIFPCKGSNALINIFITIIDLIITRFPTYPIGKIKQIGTLCCYFENFYGDLYDSRITNVPWSIIPALEEIFQKTQDEENQFVICPICVYNYQIRNRNMIDEIKTEIFKIPNLLFDVSSEYERELKVNELLNDSPKGIYFIFFPKLERLSALHFAILGHEIGHIYASKWIENNFKNFLNDNKLDSTFEKIAEKELAKQTGGLPHAKDKQDAFLQSDKIELMIEYYRISILITQELISDLYGGFLFGDTGVIASYLLAQKLDLDSLVTLKGGYPSFRYRLKFLNEALDYIKKSKGTEILEMDEWNTIIENCVKEECQDYSADEYISVLLKTIDSKKEELFQDVINNIGDQLFLNFLTNEQISYVRDRISRKITPNSYFDENNVEVPTDFRNILYGTALCHLESITDNLEDYEKKSKLINLLCIKGIELSTEHRMFINDTNKA